MCPGGKWNGRNCANSLWCNQSYKYCNAILYPRSYVEKSRQAGPPPAPPKPVRPAHGITWVAFCRSTASNYIWRWFLNYESAHLRSDVNDRVIINAYSCPFMSEICCSLVSIKQSDSIKWDGTAAARVWQIRRSRHAKECGHDTTRRKVQGTSYADLMTRHNGSPPMSAKAIKYRLCLTASSHNRFPKCRRECKSRSTFWNGQTHNWNEWMPLKVMNICVLLYIVVHIKRMQRLCHCKTIFKPFIGFRVLPASFSIRRNYIFWQDQTVFINRSHNHLIEKPYRQGLFFCYFCIWENYICEMSSLPSARAMPAINSPFMGVRVLTGEKIHIHPPTHLPACLHPTPEINREFTSN